MIEMLRSSDRLSPEQIGQVINNLNELLADYVSQSHLPEEDKVIIAAAWAVLSSNEEKCSECKGTGSIRTPRATWAYGTLDAVCEECHEGVADEAWSDAVDVLEAIWAKYDRSGSDLKHQVAEKSDIALQVLDVSRVRLERCRCSDCSPFGFSSPCAR